MRKMNLIQKMFPRLILPNNKITAINLKPPTYYFQ